MEERRAFQRIPHDGEVELGTGGQRLTGHIGNLSLGGAAVSVDQAVPADVGDAVTVRVKLCEEISFEATLQVTWCRGSILGGFWAAIDSDGLAHLKRMLMLNTGDPERAQLELLQWIRSRPGHDRGHETAES